MQTRFAPDQLADAAMRESEKILRTCVHCGFCTATCPTYLLLGDELDSPRGRIYLIKDMLEGGKPATPEVVKHIDRCLSCLSCMTTCPSGVHYMHLVDHARAHIQETYVRPPADRRLRDLYARVLPHRGRFRAALVAARLGRPFGPLVARLPGLGARLAAGLKLSPTQPLPKARYRPGDTIPPTAPAGVPRRGRVAILTGCAQQVLRPTINEAAIRLLTAHGVEVVLPKGEGCCGALVHHMGREGEAHAAAKANIDAWTREIEGEGLDAILITTSGCGTTVKDYGFMLRQDPAYAGKAARVAALARDVTEYLATLELSAPSRALKGPLAYHSACSMAGHAELLGVGLARAGAGRGQQRRDRRQRLRRFGGGRGGGRRHALDLQHRMVQPFGVRQIIRQQAQAAIGDACQENGGHDLVDFQAVHADPIRSVS